MKQQDSDLQKIVYLVRTDPEANDGMLEQDDKFEPACDKCKPVAIFIFSFECKPVKLVYSM